MCFQDTCDAPCDGYTYYTDEQIRDLLLQGIADIEFQREALSVQGIQECSVTEIIAFVKPLEMQIPQVLFVGCQRTESNPKAQLNALTPT